MSTTTIKGSALCAGSVVMDWKGEEHRVSRINRRDAETVVVAFDNGDTLPFGRDAIVEVRECVTCPSPALFAVRHFDHGDALVCQGCVGFTLSHGYVLSRPPVQRGLAVRLVAQKLADTSALPEWMACAWGHDMTPLAEVALAALEEAGLEFTRSADQVAAS